MDDTLTLFRSITLDYDAEEAQLRKFLAWGKGDIQQALNYYYVHLEKGKIRKPKPKPVASSPPDPPPVKRTQTVPEIQERSQLMVTLDVSADSEQNSQDAFSLLRRGSKKHQKTQDFIDNVRRIYQLPIRGKKQKQLLKNSAASVLDYSEQVDCPELKMVDCLADAFDSQKLEELTRSKGADTKRTAKVDVSEDQFIDIQEYQYKHVYTNKDFSPKQHRESQAQSEQKLIANEQAEKASEWLGEKPSEKAAKDQVLQQDLEDIPKKRLTRASVKREPLREQKQKKLEVVRAIPKKPEPKGKADERPSRGMVDPDYPYIEMMEDEEIFVGEYFLPCFSTEKRKLDNLQQGSPVKVVGYIEEPKTKKKSFGKKQQRIMHMRIYYDERQLGRVKDNEARILMPLIHSQLIRVEYFMHDFPLFADTFKPITLKVKIYFLSKLITEPIVESFEPNQTDKQRVHQLSGLLQKLALPLLMEPLVRGKSKYIKQNLKKKANQSIDIFNFKQYDECEEEKKRKLEQKAQNELIKKRTDPHYQPIQKSIKDMLGKTDSQRQSLLEEEPHKEGEYRVEKKVIEIDTKVERDKFSQLIELHEENIDPFFPQNNFASNLYNYQALALSWMLRKEGFSEVRPDQEEIHPLWSEYEIPTCSKHRLFFNELTGQVCIRRPTAKVQCKGGILADEMGLGKTVMMAALIVSHTPSQKLTSVSGGTLVIVPLTLLSQWESELAKHTKGLRVLIYYSSERNKYAANLHQYDVVISTYGTVSHEFAQGSHIKKSGVYKYKWHRIILDEAHYIKGRIIQTSKAVYELAGTHRWCLTGTPIQNEIGDLFSLIHFIKYAPWSEFACWSRFIAKPLEEEQQSIYGVLKTILRRVFLRRTKNSLDADGKPIVQLPPRISKVELLTMSQREKEFYDSVYAASRSDFDGLIEKGILQAKYMQVLEMLMRLRQICCHPILFKSITKFSRDTDQFELQLRKLVQKRKQPSAEGSQSDDEYYEPVIDADNQESRVRSRNPQKQISQEYFQEVILAVGKGELDCCIICLNKPEDPVINSCLHIFCRSCNIRQIQERGFCAFCRNPLSKESFIHLPRENRLNTNIDDLFLSTKMIALNEHLGHLKDGDKVVVFSQFLGMMDLLENEFRKSGFNYVRMEGSNSHKQRTKIVHAFQNDPKVQIFLVSLKTAGVGLNLVAANKVFLLDPWWNPAVEEQAIERVHRIGQKRPVEIIRFIMDRTIETRMLELNTQKKQLSQNILSNHNSEEGSAKQRVEKLKYLMENY